MAMHIYDLGWMLAQVLLLLCSAPLVAGIIKKVKSLLLLRQPPRPPKPFYTSAGMKWSPMTMRMNLLRMFSTPF